jgi:malonyl CoA-acyl carrier protein transacylase
MDLDTIKQQCQMDLARAMQKTDLELVAKICEKFIVDATQAGMSQEEANQWWSQVWQPHMDALLNRSESARPEKEKDDPLKLVATVISVILIGVISAAIFNAMAKDGEYKTIWDWIANGGWLLAFVSVPLYKFLFYILYMVFDWFRKQHDFMKAAELIREQINENKQWVWLCQRCEATYAYHGEEVAYCGRCRNKLTKVRGMTLGD